MAEFQEVIRQWGRMCNSSDRISCENCKLYPVLPEDICRNVPDVETAQLIEQEVMAWAAKHPEPVYPTWYEYLHGLGITKFYEGQHVCIDFHKVMERIPADIAQKLGLKPKEG